MKMKPNEVSVIDCSGWVGEWVGVLVLLEHPVYAACRVQIVGDN